MDKKVFNLNLTKWLNARDYVSSDWPDNVPDYIKKQADKDIGDGFTLDNLGWPMDSNFVEKNK